METFKFQRKQAVWFELEVRAVDLAQAEMLAEERFAEGMFDEVYELAEWLDAEFVMRRVENGWVVVKDSENE